MKLGARDAAQWIAKPPPDRPGTLIHGEDAMRVSLKRQELVRNLAGPAADEEMRLTRLQATGLRRDPALLDDAMKAQGFFPGPRVVLVEDATPQHATAITAALGDWRSGDAHMVVTAGAQKPASALRRTFEKHPGTGSIAVYDAPPDRQEVERWIAAAGLSPDRDAQAALAALAQDLGPGDFRQLLEKLSLYKTGDAAPLGTADVAACRPVSTEAELDDAIHAAADGRAAEIGPVLTRLAAQGAQPVALVIAATRHYRALHAAAADPGGPGSGVAKLKPPVFGPRRDAMLRQAQRLGLARIEEALGTLTDTDLSLRSTARAPQMAVVERMLIRLAMMGKR